MRSEFNVTEFSWNKNTRTFCAEASSLSVGIVPRNIKVVNDKTGNSCYFNLHKIDSNEGDVAGWRFKSIDGTINLLIIND